MAESSDPNVDTMLAQAERACARLGLQPLRAKQAEVLRNLALHLPTFAALPTGYGKSLLYWMPAVAWGWKVWAISPLISLIEDQAMACDALGIRTIAWRGGLGRAQRGELELRMRRGDWQICFLSPERFQRWSANGFLSALAKSGQFPRLLALDEMHCLEEWRGFRAGYRDLAAPLRRFLGRGPLLLGLSASLTAALSEAWMNRLSGPHRRVGAPIGRANLSLRVLPLETEEARWLLLISALRGLRAPESALVYCYSRDEADDLARWLKSAGIPAVPYHAGLPAEERSERSHAFRAGLLRVVCATTAFGMGIDYPHVGRVIHFSTPRDLESYWQEVGRAGRAGQEAFALSFWRRSEIVRARRMEEPAREKFFALWSAWASGSCRKAAVADRLGLEQENCGKCDRCEPETSAHVALGPAFPEEAWWTQPAARLDRWLGERRAASDEVKKSFQKAAVKMS